LNSFTLTHFITKTAKKEEKQSFNKSDFEQAMALTLKMR
jgi:hypothetical protein